MQETEKKSIKLSLLILVLLHHIRYCEATDCSIVQECSWWEFECGTGNCINIINFCDGRIDCPDGSDEIYTSSGCSNSHNNADYQCNLPDKYKCDSIQHCVNKTDEYGDTCQQKDRYEMRCDRYGHCINKLFLNCSAREEWSCSDKILCRDNICTRRGDHNHVTDQSTECESIPTFRCNSGMCLAADKFCDGTIDCDDGSDEIIDDVNINGGIMCSNAWNTVSQKCLLSAQHLCDGIDHCDERIDECQQGCERSFICDNGKCIYNRPDVPLLCNGRDDCGDSSDECSADIACDIHNVFTCNDGTCIAVEKFCDGRLDCPDGSDEVISSNSTDQIVCKSNHNSVTLRCVLPDHHKCDQARHCADNLDEVECSGSRWFRCKNNNLVDSTTQVCNFKDECCDSSDECGVVGCNKTFTCVTSGTCIAFERFCDGVVDCEDGSDETIVANNGSIMCNNLHNNANEKCALPNVYVCDGLDHCSNREDECTDGCNSSFFCNNGQCLQRTSLCNGVNDCEDNSDELTSGIGFKCAVSSSANDVIQRCIIPQQLLTDSTHHCRDQLDSCATDGKCFQCASVDFFVATEQVCDDVIDCPDASDECLCGNKPNETIQEICDNLCISEDESSSCGNCSRLQVRCDGGSTCFSVDEICDGSKNCEDGLDETNCIRENELESKQSKSDRSFVCQVEPGSARITFATECNGVPECTHFEDECSRYNDPSNDLASFLKSSPTMGSALLKLIAPTTPPSANDTSFVCGENTPTFCTTLYDDVTKWFHCPGKPHMILFPQDICDGIEDCPRQTDEMLSADEQNCTQRVTCELSRPVQKEKITIHKSKICDGIIDCINEEDESIEKCGNRSRFYCENREVGKNRKGPLFVPQRNVFDGKDDCFGGSDECPTEWFNENLFSSRHRMIKNMILSCMVWLMAVFALFGNFKVIWHTVIRPRPMRRISAMMKSNYLLVSNLAAADFLMGIYLLSLAIQNSTTSGRYCHADIEWRSGTACAVLGSFAMVSLQSSVLFLLILTTYRVVTVLRPFRADSLRPRYTVIIILLVWLVSILIAVIPHMTSFEDYFVSSASITPGVYLFDSNTQTRNTLYRFSNMLAIYNGTYVDQNNFTSQWSYINHVTSTLYPERWPKFEITHKMGYYSTHSVCLPRLFVTTNDSTWGYSTAIMVFDFCAFLYVVTSYIVIYHDATRRSSANNCAEVTDENKRMQARITRLVVTDFACWVPVCILVFLSLIGVDVGSVAYAVAAIVLLPINSALNPILYSNMLAIVYSSCLFPIHSALTKFVRRQRGQRGFLMPSCYRYSRCNNRGNQFSTTITNDENMNLCGGRIGSSSSESTTISKNLVSTNSASTKM